MFRPHQLLVLMMMFMDHPQHRDLLGAFLEILFDSNTFESYYRDHGVKAVEFIRLEFHNLSVLPLDFLVNFDLLFPL